MVLQTVCTTYATQHRFLTTVHALVGPASLPPFPDDRGVSVCEDVKDGEDGQCFHVYSSICACSLFILCFLGETAGSKLTTKNVVGCKVFFTRFSDVDAVD